jgi:DNA-binding MarR family transcriptional regulator
MAKKEALAAGEAAVVDDCGTGAAPDRLAPWRLFLQAHAALVERLERDLRQRRDLPLTWYEVLLHLTRVPEGRMRMTDLASSLLLSKSGVTRLIDRMEEAGLVTRDTCPSDRRGSFAVVTDRGRAVQKKAAPVHLRGVEEHFLDHLTPAEARTLTSALEKVLVAAREEQPAVAS